jgi:ribosomal protein S12 methylthiotransferase
MNRKGDKQAIANIINMIRNKIPDVKLRTSLITGFPGESEKDFNNLKEFVKEMEFDRLGVFEFSREEGTAAYNLPDRVPAEVKKKRKDQIMDIQTEISLNKNKDLLDKTLEVIIEAKDEEYYTARSRFDTPEIDNLIYIPINQNLNIGGIYEAVIQEAFHYELKGEIKNESTK